MLLDLVPQVVCLGSTIHAREHIRITSELEILRRTGIARNCTCMTLSGDAHVVHMWIHIHNTQYPGRYNGQVVERMSSWISEA